MKELKSVLSVDKREFLLITILCLFLCLFVLIFTSYYFAKDLTSKETIMNKNDTGLVLLDRHGTPFFTFYQAKYKTFIPLSHIPTHVQQAVISIEDKDFYIHSGFSFPSIIRSLIANISTGKVVSGGSTITQQLVKNALLNSRKDVTRKIQEIVLANEIENKYSKKEILEMYFNSVYFGEGAFGIENAALTYFDTSAKDLTLAQSAFLIAILPSPSRYSPYSGDIKKAYTRQKIVLQKMLEQKYITKDQKEKAEKEKLTFHPAEQAINVTAPHFALMVQDSLIKQYGEEYLSRSGIKVTTTLDLNWQKRAEQTVDEQVRTLQAENVSNGAAVVMDPKNGDIKALVGSVDWFNQKFGTVNMAITPRSVGSSFKPIVYAAAFEERLITPATVLHDQPTTFPGGYAPHDYDRKFRGNVVVRRALANSLNVPAVEIMQRVGVPTTITMAERLGIHTLKNPSNYGLSLVLGTGETKLLELTNAYSAFANNGVRAQPRMILKILDKNSKKIFTSSVQQSKAIEPETAFLISSILSDNNARREVFGNLLTIPRPAAVKTGTAEDYKDSLTVGYTPSLTIGIWIGNNNNTPMYSVAGSIGAAPIWKNLMTDYLADTAVENFLPPANIAKAPICRTSKVTDYFIPGTQPLRECITPTPIPIPTQSLFPQEDDSSEFFKPDSRSARQNLRDILRRP